MAVRMAAAVSPGEEKPGVDSVVVAAAAKELKTAMKTASKHALVRAATDGSMRYIGAKEDLNWRQKIWMTLDDPSFSKASFWYAQFSLGVIVVSTLSFCLETELTCTLKDDHEWLFVNASTNGENTCGRWEDTWKFLEMVAVYIFSAELVLRFATTPNKLIFCKGVANWIDVIAIVPFYVSQAADGDALAAFSVFRVVRLVRVFRVFKMGKSSIGISLMTATMAESMKVLFLLMYFVAIAMVLFSSMMYYAESDGEQAEFFASIPRTFWWCLVTMTTVGYGDGYPVTTPGRIIAVVTMFCGILILALPISVIGSNFERQYARLQFEQEAQKAVREGHGRIEKDKVNAKRLREFLLTLDIHGSLRVPLPQTDDAAQAIIDQFDPTKQSKLDTKQWQALLQDTVIDPSEFTDTTILKLASDLHKARAEVSELQQMMRQQATRSDEQATRSDEQMSELRGMLVSLGAKTGTPTARP